MYFRNKVINIFYCFNITFLNVSLFSPCMSDESAGAGIGTLHLMDGNNYTFLEKVGKGSQGVVYKAVDQDGNIVACKLLNEEPDEK